MASARHSWAMWKRLATSTRSRVRSNFKNTVFLFMMRYVMNVSFMQKCAINWANWSLSKSSSQCVKSCRSLTFNPHAHAKPIITWIRLRPHRGPKIWASWTRKSPLLTWIEPLGRRCGWNRPSWGAFYSVKNRPLFTSIFTSSKLYLFPQNYREINFRKCW